MPDKHYAFVDRKCPACAGTGEIPFGRMCATCSGTGMFGSYEEMPDIEYDGPSAFAHKLRKIREQRKISMADLARKFNLTVAELSGIEQGRIESIGELKDALIKWVYGGNYA